MKKLRIIQYTDPMCIWCYALDVALRKIEFGNANSVEFQNTLGLLVRDCSDIIGNDEFTHLRLQKLKMQMKSHFLDAARRGGLPINIAHLEQKQPRDITSLPASLAIEAMKIVDKNAQGAYLRRVREAFHSDGLNTSDESVLLDLAGELLSDLSAFRDALQNGEAQNALDKDLQQCYAKGVRSFPTIELVYEGKHQIIAGFMDYEELKEHISRLTQGEFILQERGFSDENLLEFVGRFSRVSESEATNALSVDKARLKECVERLCSAGILAKQHCGESYFITLAQNSSCHNGQCQNALFA